MSISYLRPLSAARYFMLDMMLACFKLLVLVPELLNLVYFVYPYKQLSS